MNDSSGAADPAAVEHRPACMACVSAVARLADSVAHDINQPLMSIAATAGAALRQARSDPAAPARLDAMLVEIVAQSQRAGDMVQSLRMLARQHVHTGWSSLHALLLDLPVQARETLERRRLSIEFDLAAPCDAVDVNTVHLRALLADLLDHAARAGGPPSSAQMVMRMATRALPGRRIELRVGFAGDEATFSGGRGLAVCRLIAEGHGGSLALHPEAAGGAIVVILPAAQVQNGR